MISVLTKISAFFFTLLMPMVVAFNGISVALPFTADSASIEYAFLNEEAGSAAGTVTVKASLGGEYDLYWGDEDGKKLSVDVGDSTAYYSEFATVSVSEGEGSAEIQQFTAIPEGAETVVVYKMKTPVGTMDIPENKLADNGKSSIRSVHSAMFILTDTEARLSPTMHVLPSPMHSISLRILMLSLSEFQVIFPQTVKEMLLKNITPLFQTMISPFILARATMT